MFDQSDLTEVVERLVETSNETKQIMLQPQSLLLVVMVMEEIKSEHSGEEVEG